MLPQFFNELMLKIHSPLLLQVKSLKEDLQKGMSTSFNFFCNSCGAGKKIFVWSKGLERPIFFPTSYLK